MVAMVAIKELIRSFVTRKPLTAPTRPHTRIAEIKPATPPYREPTSEDIIADSATDIPSDRSISPEISRKDIPMAAIPYILKSASSL